MGKGRERMKSIAVVMSILVLLGAGCNSSPPVDLMLGAGDTLTIRQTVFGVGGKLTEFVGVAPEERTVLVPDAWPSSATDFADDTFVLLPRESYAELSETGQTHISLGLYDQKISDALGLVDRLNAVVTALGGSSVLETREDVLLVTVSDENATDWVRLNGRLVQVRAIKASNRFASYVILANQETPVILSLTLKPAARAELDALSSFEGFEISEITKAGE